MCNGNDIGQIVLVMPFALFSKTEVQNEINQHFNKYRANVKLLRAKKKKIGYFSVQNIFITSSKHSGVTRFH